MNAVLIIDKPSGLTSHDVVNRARRILQQRSVGHLGTLDPMATGVLPLVIGNLTRLAQFYTNAEKTYEGAIRFGFSTDTYDAEGEPRSAPQPVTLDPDQIHELAARFRGTIEQIPPPFSAKKIHGVPAYKLARKQKEVVLKPVQVEIKEFEILSVEADRVRFRARVASGTYMRSVAHDMGQALACGAHLESLRRTAVAEFTLEDAHTLEEVAEAAGKSWPNHKENTENTLTSNEASSQSEQIPVAADSREAAQECSPRPALSLSKGRKPWVDAASHEAPEGRKKRTPEALEVIFVHPRKLLPHLPSVTADDLTAARIRAGRTVNLPELSRARQVKVFASQTDLLAIATRIAGTLFHPKIVLSGSDPGGADTPFDKLRAGSVGRL